MSLSEFGTPAGGAAPVVLQEVPAGARYAGFWIRALARVLDSIAGVFIGAVTGFSTAFVLALMGLPVALSPRFAIGPLAISWLAAMCGSIAYHVASEWIGGATLGKAIVGLRVRSEGLGPCGLRGASLRSVAFYVDGLFFGLVAFNAMSESSKRQRYGDKWGATVVVEASSLPPLVQRGARVAAGVATGVALWMLFLVPGQVLATIVRARMPEPAVDPSTVVLSQERTTPNGLLKIHYPADFAAKTLDASSLLVVRNYGGGSEGASFTAVRTPISSDVGEFARVVVAAIEKDILSMGGFATRGEMESAACLGRYSGLEVANTYRVSIGGHFVSKTCSFIHGGHGYTLRYFASDSRAALDGPLLERIVGATELLSAP